jgi:chromatin remodeling complex protein RSC6
MPVEKKTKQTASTAPVATAGATKGRKTPAKAEVSVPTLESSTVPVTETTTPTPTETRSTAVILAELQDTLKAISSDMSARVRAAVQTAGDAVKALKRDAREGKRRHRKNVADMTPEEKAAWEARRANNAFLKLRPISDELSTFMGLPAKSQKSQTDVTKFVSSYVKQHNCFDPNFKRRIIPDAKLAKLLRVKDGQEVTYLNLQSFLKVHFIKPTA